MRTLLHMWKGKGALWSFTSCSSGLQQRELGVVGAYQQLWTEPDFCNLAENALLIITAEERVIGPKYSREHILQTREERGFRQNIQLGPMAQCAGLASCCGPPPTCSSVGWSVLLYSFPTGHSYGSIVLTLTWQVLRFWHRKIMLVMAPDICHASISSSATCAHIQRLWVGTTAFGVLGE